VIIVITEMMSAARADVPVKIASVPDGPIRLAVSEDAGELRRTFRLMPQALDQVKIDQVRVVDCIDTHGQSCVAHVEPGGCANGCTLTATEPGAATAVVTLPAPGTYTSSLEIVYVKEEKPLPDNKVQVVKAVLSTTLEVTRPAPTVQPMKIALAGPTGTEVTIAFLQRGSARLRWHVQDDDGAARKLAQIVATPLALRSGNDALATDAEVKVLANADRLLVDGAPLDLPQGGATLNVEVTGLAEPGKYDGKLRLLAPGRTPQDLTYTITVRDGISWASALIALGTLLSFGVQWWVGQRRMRLVQQKTLERLRDRLQDIAQRDGLADRDRQLIDALLREIDDDLYKVEDGNALASDALTRLADRVALTDTLVKTGQDVERLPLAARSDPRNKLDIQALGLADRTVDDKKLKDIAVVLFTVASVGVRRAALVGLLTALDAAVEQVRTALSPTLRQRLTEEVVPALRDAHAATDRDKLEDLDDALARGRRALAKIQGATLAERLPAARPKIFDDDATYNVLRNDVNATLAALDVASDADDAVRLYQNAVDRFVPALCDATARWCRAQSRGKPTNVQSQLDVLATRADTARSKPAGEALAIVDRVMADAEDLASGARVLPTGANERGRERASVLATIPWLTPLVGGRRWRRSRTGGLIAVGDVVVLVALTVIAIATGLKLLWVSNPTWGGWGDWITAGLWGAGLHAVGNDSFKGLLGLKKKLGEPE